MTEQPLQVYGKVVNEEPDDIEDLQIAALFEEQQEGTEDAQAAEGIKRSPHPKIASPCKL